MPEHMLDYNISTLKELEQYIARGEDCCVVNPCGSGKTSVMCGFIMNHKDSRITVLTRQKNAREYYESLSDCFDTVNIRTYNKMLRDYKANRLDDYNADYIIADEAHYVGAPEWGNAVYRIKEKFHPVFIGFTATPQRFEDQGTDNTIVTGFFGGNSEGNYTVKDLQRRGVFQEPEYILSIYSLESEVETRLEKLEDTDLSDIKKLEIRDRLYDIFKDWKRNSCPEVVMKEALPRYMYKPCCNRILVYMPSIAELEAKYRDVDRLIQACFPDRRIKSYCYTYKSSENEFRAFLEEDNTSYIKVLYSIDKVMETIHIDDLNIMLMLRPSVSNRIITQQFGRVNSIGNDKKPLIIDMVGNLSNLDSVRFLGDRLGERSKNGNGRPDFNIRHTVKYAGLFSAIDGCLVKSVYYTYLGITDTLYRLCQIFNKDFHESRDLVKDKGIDIEDAFATVRQATGRHISQDIFDGNMKVPEFTLDELQKSLVEKYMGAVDRFIVRNHIDDDDLKQNLYLVMMKAVSDLAGKDTNLSQKILGRLQEYYTKARRNKIAREELYDTRDISDIPLYAPQTLENKATEDTLRDTMIPMALKTLTKREQEIMVQRFACDMTLEDIAKEHDVTRERIRQIEAKALRKLRHPTRLRLIGAWPVSEGDIFTIFNDMGFGKACEYSDGRLT